MVKNRPKLREIIAFEKQQMLPLNFFVSYLLCPIYLMVSLLLLILFGVLMEIDDERYLLPGLLCLGFVGLLTALLLALVPYVRKTAIQTELQRYDFDTAEIPEPEIWDHSTDDFSLKFDIHGMYVDGRLFYYNHLSKLVVTDNYCKRINIGVEFSPSEDQIVTLPLDGSTLKMLQCLGIKLDNQQLLDYILENKKAAFHRIYDKGYINIS